MAADLDLLEELYAFVKARQNERIKRSQKQGWEANRRERERLRTIQLFYAEAVRNGTNAALAAEIDVLRKHAMRDSDHRDYDPLWTLPAS